MIKAAIRRNDARLTRGEPADLAAIVAEQPTWRATALALHRPRLVWQLAIQSALRRYCAGSAAAAHADLMRLWDGRPPDEPWPGARTIEGTVVDGRGAPVAGRPSHSRIR